MSIFAVLLDAPAAEEPPTIGTVHAAARAFVAAELAGRGESHGLGHSLRVRNLALAIFDAGGLDARGGAGFDARRVVELAALLHDVCDHKYVDAATAPGAAAVARRDAFLAAHASPAEAAACVAVIAEVSYSREAKARRRGEAPAWRALDEPARTLRHVVSDADKIDAIGPAGLRRCVEYRRESAPPGADLAPAAVVADVAAHCDEKLLLLAPDFVHTPAGRALAAPGHAFLARWREDARAALDAAAAASGPRPGLAAPEVCA